MRPIYLKLHLWLSIPLGIVFILSCLSGILLIFEPQLTELAHPDVYKVEQRGNSILNPQSIVEKVKPNLPDSLKIVWVELPATSNSPALIGFKNFRSKKLSVDPATGEIKGWVERTPFFKKVKALHCALLLKSNGRAKERTPGQRIIGYATLGTMIVLITGIIAWVSKNKRAWRKRFKISKKNLLYDLHLVAGFYASIVLLIVCISGLTWSFDWFRTVVYGACGVRYESKPTGGMHTPSTKMTPISKEELDLWNKEWSQAKSIYPSSLSIRLLKGEAQVYLNNRNYPTKMDRILFRGDGSVDKIVRAEEQPKLKKMKALFYSLHVGNFWGMWSKILYAIALLMGVFLTLTGYYLWLRRLKRKAVR